MPRIKTTPVRMCVLCRTRELQNKLSRLRCEDRQIRPYTGKGRSFYLCTRCLEDKRLEKALARQCKTGETKMLLSQLKEIIADGR